MIETKEAIGKELIQWLPHDKNYVYTLNVYALSKGLISEEDSVKVKETLDEYYKEDVQATSKSKFMLEVFKLLGYSKTKLLFNIIDYFPKHYKGKITDQIVMTNPEYHQRVTGITAKDYYAYMRQYEELGYLKRVMGLKYFIDFNKIKETAEYEYKGDTL